MVFLVALMLGSWAVVLEGSGTEAIKSADERQPIWNIANMVTDINQINETLDLGANSIETDVTFDDGTMAGYTYEGVLCACSGSCTKKMNIGEFLHGLRRVTTPGDPMYRKELALVVFNLKTSDFSPSTAYESGMMFGGKLLQIYWNGGKTERKCDPIKGIVVSRNDGGKAYIIISIPDIEYFAFISGFRKTLEITGNEEILARVGYEVSGNYYLGLIRDALEKAGVKDREHVWQSDGITNCIPRDLNLIEEAVKNRDSPDGYINKVYHSTIEDKAAISDALDAGVDGIISQRPDMIFEVLLDDRFINRFRLATSEDNPWANFRY